MGSHKKFDSSSESSDEELRNKKEKKKEKYTHSKESTEQRIRKDSSEEDRSGKKKSRHEEYKSCPSRKRHRDYDKHDDRESGCKRRDQRSGGSRKDEDDKKNYQSNRDSYRHDRSNCSAETSIRDHGRNKAHNRNDRSWDSKLSQEEISKQRRMLWSKQKATDDVIAEPRAPSSSTAAPADKNAALWTSSITAAGVEGQQANKFLKLMGIKSAPPSTATMTDDVLKKEHDRQQKMKADLDKQYQIARESTHMGRGMGLGFH